MDARIKTKKQTMDINLNQSVKVIINSIWNICIFKNIGKRRISLRKGSSIIKGMKNDSK